MNSNTRKQTEVMLMTTIFGDVVTIYDCENPDAWISYDPAGTMVEK